MLSVASHASVASLAGVTSLSSVTIFVGVASLADEERPPASCNYGY